VRSGGRIQATRTYSCHNTSPSDYKFIRTGTDIKPLNSGTMGRTRTLPACAGVRAQRAAGATEPQPRHSSIGHSALHARPEARYKSAHVNRLAHPLTDVPYAGLLHCRHGKQLDQEALGLVSGKIPPERQMLVVDIFRSLHGFHLLSTAIRTIDKRPKNDKENEFATRKWQRKPDH